MKLKRARIPALLAIVIAAVVGWQEKNPDFLASLFEALGQNPARQETTVRVDDQALRQAIRQQRSDVQVRGSGRVQRLLPDDNEGSRHQKFILRLPSGDTLLIAHNIDLAPRIPGLGKGDRVEFFGEYEWNERGGVVHWTHHDPAGRHVDGWLKHEGKTYQ